MPSQVNIDDDRPGTYEDACRMLIQAHTENEPALERRHSPLPTRPALLPAYPRSFPRSL
jgi:hypothetical protein